MREFTELYPSEDFEITGQEDVDYLVTRIKCFTEDGSEARANIRFGIPDSDTVCQTRYNCTLKDLIIAGVRQLATRIDYPAEFIGRELDKAGKVIRVGYVNQDTVDKMQKAANAYKVGSKATGTSAKIKKIASVATKKGLTMDELLAEVEAIKPKQEQEQE